jgi:glycosyltransferase involved in cell wall biosynthesis
LFFVRERFPSHRVRINVLFGKELLGRGHAIDLVMQAENVGGKTGAVSWCGGTVFVGRTCRTGNIVGRALRHVLSLWHDIGSFRHIRRGRWSVIQVSDKFVTGTLALAVARLRGLKFIFWLTFPVPEAQLLRAHTRTARYPVLAWIRGRCTGFLLYRVLLPHSDHVLVQSEQMKRDLMARGIEPRKMTPVVTGVDLDQFDPGPIESPRDGGGAVTIGYLGTLAADRHLTILVDALQLLRQRGVDARLLFIGDADLAADRQLLEEHAARLGLLPYLEITGFLPQREAFRRMRTATIGVSPFFPTPILDSTSPTKLVEYMALGIPVLANDHPEQRQILHESRAGLCVPWGARFFARGAAWLIHLPAGKRAQMAQAGRSWVEANRSYSRIADELEATYDQVVHGAGLPNRS